MVMGRSPITMYMASKVALLKGSILAEQRGAPLRCGQRSSTDRLDAVALKEHMLGTAQANALSAEVNGMRGIAGVSALVKTFRRRTLSAQPIKRPKSPEMVASVVGMASP